MPDRPTVVFERNSPARVGRLRSKSGESLDVEWEDGSFQTVQSGAFLDTEFGSSTFIRYALPDVWDAAWANPESSAQILALILSEQGDATFFRILRKRAQDLGTPALAQKEWDRLSTQFRKIAGVSPREGKRLTWDSEDRPDLLPDDARARWPFLFELTDAATPAIQTDRRDQTDPGVVSKSAEEHSAGKYLPPTEHEPAVSANSTGSIETRAEDTRSRKSDGQTLELASDLSHGEPSVSTLDQFCTEIVAGARVNQLFAKQLFEEPTKQQGPLTSPASKVRAAIGALEPDDRWRASTSLLLAKDLLTREQLSSWSADPRSPETLEALARRIQALTVKDREKALGPFARAVEALLAPRKAADRTRDEVASGAVLKMPSTLSVLASATPQFLSSADALAGAMATALRARGSGSTGDIDRLKPHIVKLPFNPGGGRFRFLVALSADETLALPADWLEGLGPDELIALSDADSARLTRVPSWRSRVGEIAKQAILAATTRGRLLSLLASGAIATSVAPETASKAFQRVGGTDSAVRQWLQFLGRQDLIDDLTSAVSRLEARTADAENRASRQTAIASDANSRIAELQRRLDSAADSHDSVHDATLLQAERDAYRLVARILATAESEARNLNADQLATRLRQVVRVQGIEAIGTRDEVAVFDPAVHDAPSGRPPAGARVRVGRPGYKWIREDGEEVLVKALVATET